MRTLLVALLLVPRLVAAEPAKLTLDQVIAKAVVEPPGADGRAATSMPPPRGSTRPMRRGCRGSRRAGSRRSARRSTASMPVAPSTEPQNFAFRFSGFFAGAQLDLTQPLYTFGKIDHARKAARAGLDAQAALADEAAGDVASDAARAYWGLKLARELGDMLDDGIERDRRCEAALRRQQGHHDPGSPARRGAARPGQGPARRRPPRRGPGARRPARGHRRPRRRHRRQRARRRRPRPAGRERARGRPPAAAARGEVRRSGGGRARRDGGRELLSRHRARRLGPGGARAGRRRSAERVRVRPLQPGRGRPRARACSGRFEPWNTKARTARARAEAHKAHEQAALAELGARYDAETALAEARAAHDKVEATATGEKAARTWLASVLQNEAIGTAESRDLVDAYVAWFQLRAQWATRGFRVERRRDPAGPCPGEFRAGTPRPEVNGSRQMKRLILILIALLARARLCRGHGVPAKTDSLREEAPRTAVKQANDNRPAQAEGRRRLQGGEGPRRQGRRFACAGSSTSTSSASARWPISGAS